MVQDTALEPLKHLGAGCQNVTVPGFLCQPCAGKSALGPSVVVSVLFSIYGSEPQSGLDKQHIPPQEGTHSLGC